VAAVLVLVADFTVRYDVVSIPHTPSLADAR
jgi:hypothetical protein